MVGGNGGNSSATGKPPKCSHCGGKHQRESCFEIIGYLEWWKYKKGRTSMVTGGGEQQAAAQIHYGSEDGGPPQSDLEQGLAANTIGTEGTIQNISHRNSFNVLAEIDDWDGRNDYRPNPDANQVRKKIGEGFSPTDERVLQEKNLMRSSETASPRHNGLTPFGLEEPSLHNKTGPCDGWIHERLNGLDQIYGPNTNPHHGSTNGLDGSAFQPIDQNGLHTYDICSVTNGPDDNNILGFVGYISLGPENKSECWLLDSGASDHMTYSKHDITAPSIPKKAAISNANRVTYLVISA